MLAQIERRYFRLTLQIRRLSRLYRLSHSSANKQKRDVDAPKVRLQISMSSNIASSRHLLPLVRPWARDYDDRVRLGDYLRERGFEWFAGV